MKLLIDEMYPPGLAEHVRAIGIDAVTVADLGLAGHPDVDVFAAGLVSGRAVLTENLSDFARIAAQHSTSGGHHPGVLIALSGRFSRRPAGIQAIVAAIESIESDQLNDRVVYLRRASDDQR